MAALAKEAGCDAISFTPFKTNRGKLSHYALSEEEQKNLCNHMIRLKKQIRAYSLDDNVDRLLLRYRFNDISHKAALLHMLVSFPDKGRRNGAVVRALRVGAG